MSDSTIELTRRKVLAGLGAVGAAGAGAGVGTSALFTDEESFANNSIVAGTLDLKVDWEEHYSFPQTYGFEDPTVGLDVTRSEPSETAGYTALPDPENPLLWVDSDDLDAYMNNTAIESYPDSDGNRIQDDLAEYDACEDFADTPTDMDPATGLRTENADTTGEETWAPLVSLGDVKPGDFGELTLSFHLCDNPGYVWLQGNPVRAAEGGHTEPEGGDSNEEGGAEEVATGAAVLDSDVELLDEVRTLLWYDEDGDNVYDPGADEEDVDLMVVFDQSESMNSNVGSSADDNPSKLDNAVSGAQSLVGSVGGSTNVGLAMFSSPAMTQVVRALGSSKTDINADLDALDGPDDTASPVNDNNDPPNSEGSASPQVDSNDDGKDDDNLLYQTDLKGGIEVAHDELTGPNARSGARKVIVLLGDGAAYLEDGDDSDSGVISAADDAKDDDIEIFTIAYGAGADEPLLESVASDPADSEENTYAFSGGEADISNIFGQIGQIIGGEKAFFRGSLRELLEAVSSGDGIPLDGNRDTLFDEENDPPDDEDREEFSNSTNNFVGFAWWLPTSVGNQVQSDSVGFDLGFYTEQARNNDG